MCETWSLILSQKRRLVVFENRVLRRIFGNKRGEVTGKWSRLHNGDIAVYNMYVLTYIFSQKHNGDLHDLSSSLLPMFFG